MSISLSYSQVSVLVLGHHQLLIRFKRVNMALNFEGLLSADSILQHRLRSIVGLALQAPYIWHFKAMIQSYVQELNQTPEGTKPQSVPVPPHVTPAGMDMVKKSVEAKLFGIWQGLNPPEQWLVVQEVVLDLDNEWRRAIKARTKGFTFHVSRYRVYWGALGLILGLSERWKYHLQCQEGTWRPTRVVALLPESAS